MDTTPIIGKYPDYFEIFSYDKKISGKDRTPEEALNEANKKRCRDLILTNFLPCLVQVCLICGMNPKI